MGLNPSKGSRTTEMMLHVDIENKGSGDILVLKINIRGVRLGQPGIARYTYVRLAGVLCAIYNLVKGLLDLGVKNNFYFGGNNLELENNNLELENT